VGTDEAIAEAVRIASGLARPFEGLRLAPYICPAGYPTIGYGTVWKPDGTRVTMQDAPITRETAEAWLLHEMRHTYVAGVLRATPNLIEHPPILGALGDFAYNTGVPRYRASTLRKRAAAEDWPGAIEQLGRWVYGGGRKLPGLVRRRAAAAGVIRRYLEGRP
jgi:lysozyme